MDSREILRCYFRTLSDWSDFYVTGDILPFFFFFAFMELIGT